MRDIWERLLWRFGMRVDDGRFSIGAQVSFLWGAGTGWVLALLRYHYGSISLRSLWRLTQDTCCAVFEFLF